jgi:hypothetical protein
MTTDNFCFYLQKRLIQASQTGGQRYSDTSPFSIPCLNPWMMSRVSYHRWSNPLLKLAPSHARKY